MAPPSSEPVEAGGPAAAWPARTVPVPGAAAPGGPGGRTKPTIRCGTCRAVLADIGPARHVRCPGCGRRLAVPARITVRCRRCGQRQRVRPCELASEPRCASCGQPLGIRRLVLVQRWRGRAGRARRPGGGHGDAAWAVLILGLTILICVLSMRLF